jgi:hypothetical protein
MTTGEDTSRGTEPPCANASVPVHRAGLLRGFRGPRWFRRSLLFQRPAIASETMRSNFPEARTCRAGES